MMAVIINAVTEAAGAVRTTSSETARIQIRAQALAWFRDQSPDFRLVCMAAGLEPESVSRAALAYIESLGPPVKGKRRIILKREPK